MLDYADTATLISPAGVLRGKTAIRGFFADLLQAVPKAQWGVTTIYVDNVLFLEWTADSPRTSISDGVNTFIIPEWLNYPSDCAQYHGSEGEIANMRKMNVGTQSIASLRSPLIS